MLEGMLPVAIDAPDQPTTFRLALLVTLMTVEAFAPVFVKNAKYFVQICVALKSVILHEELSKLLLNLRTKKGIRNLLLVETYKKISISYDRKKASCWCRELNLMAPYKLQALLQFCIILITVTKRDTRPPFFKMSYELHLN